MHVWFQDRIRSVMRRQLNGNNISTSCVQIVHIYVEMQKDGVNTIEENVLENERKR